MNYEPRRLTRILLTQILQAGLRHWGRGGDLQVPGGEPRRGGGRHGPAHHPLPAPGEAPPGGLRDEDNRVPAGGDLLRVRGPPPHHSLEEDEQVSEDISEDFGFLSNSPPRTMTELQETSPTLVIERLTKVYNILKHFPKYF